MVRWMLALVVLCASARAEKRELRAPSKLVARRDRGDVLVSATGPYERTVVGSAPGRVLGSTAELRIGPAGGTLETADVVLTGSLTFEELHEQRLKAPAGKAYDIELVLTAFETEVPPEHMWNPKARGYRVLWTRTLTARVGL
jgi:hypothetical protein